MNIKLMTMIEDSLEFPYGVVKEVKWIRKKEFEISPTHKVEMLPFRSNCFYFTHDFWLSSHTLIISIASRVSKTKNIRFAEEIIVLKLEMPDLKEEKNPSSHLISSEKTQEPVAYVTRISPPSYHVQSCVLTHDKKKLILDCGSAFLIVDPHQGKILEEIPTSQSLCEKKNYQEIYRRGQLSLTSDDRFLMYEVNISLHNPKNALIWNRADLATFIEIFDLEKRTFYAFANRPSPAFWNHVLGNPKKPTQVSVALIHSCEEFTVTKEIDQRLWLFDISPFYKSEIALKKEGEFYSLPLFPLYTQKRTFWGKKERITHECWANNGEYLTFIVRRNKIKRVFLEDQRDEIIMDGKRTINPWHCDGHNIEYIVFDTLNKNTGIWIQSLKDKSQRIHLAYTKTEKRGQMHHPHPFFSKDLRYVFFNSDHKGEEHVFRALTCLYPS